MVFDVGLIEGLVAILFFDGLKDRFVQVLLKIGRGYYGWKFLVFPSQFFFLLWGSYSCYNN